MKKIRKNKKCIKPIKVSQDIDSNFNNICIIDNLKEYQCAIHENCKIHVWDKNKICKKCNIRISDKTTMCINKKKTQLCNIL